MGGTDRNAVEGPSVAAKRDAEGRLCPACGKDLRLASPHLVVEGGAVRVFCSEACKRARNEPAVAPAELPRRRGRRVLLVALAGLGTGGWQLGRAHLSQVVLLGAVEPAPSAAEPAPAELASAEDAPAPPVSFNQLLWTAELASDHWVHPLPGPARRMPRSDSRIFGADRAGDRPAECFEGHCGVDLGGETWGEPILAVHDGVVDRVQRGANEEHGGQYVRIAHRDGTVFTQYFHLAAIPRRLVAGTRVRAGEVVGLLGDTGVHHSSAHLHFTISVMPPDGAERFIDPEPLIALWPLSIPVYGTTARIAAAGVAPGVPRGPHRRRARRIATKVRGGEAGETTPDLAPPDPILPGALDQAAP